MKSVAMKSDLTEILKNTYSLDEDAYKKIIESVNRKTVIIFKKPDGQFIAELY